MALRVGGCLAAVLMLLPATVPAAGQAGDAIKAEALAEAERAQGLDAERHGFARASLAHHQRELEIATRAKLPAAMRRAYDRLADVSINLGDAAKFFEYAQRAFELTPSPGDHDRALYLFRVGSAYDNFQDVERADRTLAEAFTLSQKSADPVLGARILNARGVLYIRTDIDPARGLRYHDQALALLDGRGDDPSVRIKASILNNSGNALRDNPATAGEALRRYRAALAIVRRLRAADVVPFPLKNIGRVLRMQRNLREAEPTLVEAIQAADEADVTRIRWQARMELGSVLRESDPDRAERWYREALDVLEGQHSNVLLEDYQAGALGGDLSMYDNPYDLLVDLLVRRQRIPDAFVVAERARARAFLETLAGAREAVASRVPEAFIRDERELLRRISDEQGRLRLGQLATAAREKLTGDLERDEDRLAALRVRLAAERPDLGHVRFPALPTIADLQRRIVAPDEAVLEYFLGAERSTLWVVRRDGLSVVRLPRKADVEAEVRRHLAAISTPGSEYAKVAETLSRTLIDAAIPDLTGVRRLIVIPHGILHYLPFETLVDRPGRFLVETYVMSYAPSASSLAFLRSRPAPPPGDVIAIGNPTFRGEGTATDRGLAIERIGLLKPLAHAGRELDAVARSYRGTRVLARDAATEPALANAGLDRAAIVHFATHGLIDEEVPQRSGLALTMAPPASDGILQLREIYQIRLNAALVTLSACQTALGKAVTGEGIIGLSRAFFYAGAHAVVASLWNIDDESTADLMTRFYAALRDGDAIDEAARAAKLAFIKAGGRRGHPYFWGAFIATGDARLPVSVVQPRGSLTLAWLALGVAVAAGLLMLGRRLRRPAVSRVPIQLSVDHQ